MAGANTSNMVGFDQSQLNSNITNPTPTRIVPTMRPHGSSYHARYDVQVARACSRVAGKKAEPTKV